MNSSNLGLWCNCSCGGNISSFYRLTNTCSSGEAYTKYEKYWTAGLHFTLFALCLISVILTILKYNSIHVLNLRYTPTAISNILWLFYFISLGIRSLLLGLFYIFGDRVFTYHHLILPKVLFPTENTLRILQVTFLALALEYQRKHRSKGFIQDVIEKFNAESSFEVTKNCLKYVCQKVFCSTYTMFVIQALASLGLMTATFIFILKYNAHDHTSSTTIAILYWSFNSFIWALGISCIALVLIIMCRMAMDAEEIEHKGPSKRTKVLLLFGVVLSLPGDIPVFVWQNCILEKPSVSGYYIGVPLMLFALVCFMAVLISEFVRLKEEAQWSVIDQTESHYSFTESM